jgi:hypothetical protein
MRPVHRPDPLFKNVPYDLWAKNPDNLQYNVQSPTESSSAVSDRVRLFLLRNCKSANSIETPSTEDQPDSTEPSPRPNFCFRALGYRVEQLVDRAAFSMYKMIVKIENAVHSRTDSQAQ